MKPLAGCRILDLGIITAGAATSALLADFGAEVIKIESPTYRDPFRKWLAERPAGSNPDISPFFRATNREKMGVSINLKQPAGRELFLRLVAKSDVVVENFRRGVLQKLGIAYKDLIAVNPGIILASISSQGETGPEAGYVSYGSTLEAVAGLAATTGYAGERPTLSGVDLNYPDQIVAIFAASMVVTAWLQRGATGQGVHLDLSQRELTSYLSGEAFIEAGAGLSPTLTGNPQAPFALQDCVLAADERWVAVTATRVDLERSGLTAEAIADRIGALPAEEAVTDLQAAGIAAATVVNGHEVLAGRSTWEHALQIDPSGAVVKGFPLQFDRTPLSISIEAPGIGVDAEAVLCGIAGLSMEELADLADSGAIELHSPFSD